MTKKTKIPTKSVLKGGTFVHVPILVVALVLSSVDTGIGLYAPKAHPPMAETSKALRPMATAELRSNSLMPQAWWLTPAKIKDITPLLFTTRFDPQAAPMFERALWEKIAIHFGLRGCIAAEIATGHNHQPSFGLTDGGVKKVMLIDWVHIGSIKDALQVEEGIVRARWDYSKSLPFKRDSLDLVAFNRIVSCGGNLLNNINTVFRSALMESFRSLRPGGRVVIVEGIKEGMGPGEKYTLRLPAILKEIGFLVTDIVYDKDRQSPNILISAVKLAAESGLILNGRKVNREEMRREISKLMEGGYIFKVSVIGNKFLVATELREGKCHGDIPFPNPVEGVFACATEDKDGGVVVSFLLSGGKYKKFTEEVKQKTRDAYIRLARFLVGFSMPPGTKLRFDTKLYFDEVKFFDSATSTVGEVAGERGDSDLLSPQAVEAPGSGRLSPPESIFLRTQRSPDDHYVTNEGDEFILRAMREVFPEEIWQLDLFSGPYTYVPEGVRVRHSVVVALNHEELVQNGLAGLMGVFSADLNQRKRFEDLSKMWKGNFDVVTLINGMAYVKDVTWIFSIAANALNSRGIFFIAFTDQYYEDETTDRNWTKMTQDERVELVRSAIMASGQFEDVVVRRGKYRDQCEFCEGQPLPAQERPICVIYARRKPFIRFQELADFVLLGNTAGIKAAHAIDCAA